MLSFSWKYETKRGLLYQNISDMVYDDLKFSRKDCWCINKIEKHIKKSAEYLILDVLKASAGCSGMHL